MVDRNLLFYTCNLYLLFDVCHFLPFIMIQCIVGLTNALLHLCSTMSLYWIRKESDGVEFFMVHRWPCLIKDILPSIKFTTIIPHQQLNAHNSWMHLSTNKPVWLGTVKCKEHSWLHGKFDVRVCSTILVRLLSARFICYTWYNPYIVCIHNSKLYVTESMQDLSAYNNWYV